MKSMRATGPATSELAPVLRRALYGVFATCVVGGTAAVVMAVPSATAATDPCAASEIARTIGSVATNTGNYLAAHQDTNTALTAAAQQSGPQALAAMKSYFDANPQAGKDLDGIQQPLKSLTGKCKLPLTIPQILQMVQGTQQAQSPGAAARPGGASSQTATVPNGPLPGPVATTSAGPASSAPTAR